MAYPPDGYFDGIADANGNITEDGKLLLAHVPPLVERTGTGWKLINGGQPIKGSANWNSNTPGQPGDPAPTPGAGSSAWDPQGVVIGDNGDAYLFMRQYDPAAEGGKGGYVIKTYSLGNPTTPGFDWNVAGANTNLPASVLKAQFEAAQQQQASSNAQKLAMGQWHFDSMSPYTGAITLKNGANVPVTIPLSAVNSPDFAKQFPGASVADIQREVQSVNQQNWLDYGFTAPGTKNYRSYNYMSLTPGIGQTPPATAPVPNPVAGTPPGTRPGGDIAGATPNPTPGVDPNHRTPVATTGTTPTPTPTPGPGQRVPGTPPVAAATTASTAAAPPPAPLPLPVVPANPVMPPTGPVPMLPDMRR